VKSEKKITKMLKE